MELFADAINAVFNVGKVFLLIIVMIFSSRDVPAEYVTDFFSDNEDSLHKWETLKENIRESGLEQSKYIFLKYFRFFALYII